jgi:FkbM family methyltransferase
MRPDPILRALFAIACLLGTVLTACGDDAPPLTGPGLEASDLPPATRAGVERAIQKNLDLFHNAPGRTGILAEEPRYSRFAEEVLIRHFFQDREGGFFLDVGCAWPIRSSNTYYLEHHLGWTGIGIDALPDYAEGWAADRPGSKFFQFLVTDHTSPEARFYRSPGLGLSSADRNRASARRFGPPMETEEISTPSTTLDDLLDREGVTKVDLVSMDIEGHEPKALAGFDVERFRPDLLVIEGKSAEVKRLLEQRDYEQIQAYTAFDRVNRYFRRADAQPAQ